jgi:photosystem II stability/assembly factor-like uncharacterized protein
MFLDKKMVFTPFKTFFPLFLFAGVLVSGIFVSCKNHSSDSEEKLEMDGMEKAMRQQFLMTRDPALNRVPTERLLDAMRFMNNARTTLTSNLTWTERGPNNIGGRSRTIMIDKNDPTGNTVFAASVSGGIFKTSNMLSAVPSWTVVNDLMANLAVTALVQDRSNYNIMYAGTGEGWFNLDAVRGAGIFKSTDGGVTWSQIPSTSGFEFVQDIVIDNNGNLYVALRNLTSSNRGVMRSTDGGGSWTQVLGLQVSDPSPCPGVTFTTGRACDLEVATNGDVYAALGIFTPTQIFKSSFATYGANTGDKCNWQEITPPHTETTFRAEVAIAPSNAQRVYVMMQDSATDQVKTFYRSNDGGATWGSFTAPSALNNGNNSQTWYDLIMAVDSANADNVVVGGIQLAKSIDGGATWSNITSSGNMHVDQHALVFLNSSTLLVGNDGGIYLSRNFGVASPTFAAKNNGFNVTQFYGCDFHPNDEDYFLAGAQDNNTQQFTSPGMNSTVPVIGGDGGIPHINQTDGLLQIAATLNNNYYRSQDGGGTFTSLGGTVNNDKGQFINPTDLDDGQNILYCGSDTTHYYRISNLAGSPVGTNLRIVNMGTRGVTAVKVDPTAANTIWLGCSVVDETTSNLAPMVLKITNANGTPTVALARTISAGTDASGVQAYVSSIDVDASNGNNILVTFSNFGVQSVWQSVDGGLTFNSLDNNGVNLPDIPVFWGIFAPAGAQLNGTTGGGIIIGTALGIWTASTISGNTTQWIANNNGLANVPVYMVKYRSANTSLVVATHGRGLFTAPLTGVVTGVSNNVITKDFIKYISADVNQLLVVKGDLNTAKMSVRVYDAAGKLLYNQVRPYQNLTIPISTWSKGTYIIKMEGNNKENFVRQFVKY